MPVLLPFIKKKKIVATSLISFDPFTVMSLSSPVIGNCTLIRLLRSLYEECSIGYRCFMCNIVDRGVRKMSIKTASYTGIAPESI